MRPFLILWLFLSGSLSVVFGGLAIALLMSSAWESAAYCGSAGIVLVHIAAFLHTKVPDLR